MNRLLLAALSATAASALSFTDGSATYPGARLLGAGIEGASVDASGNIYAVNATTLLNLNTGTSLYTASPDAGTNFASSRHLPGGNILLGDAAGHTISYVVNNNLDNAFADTTFEQPNDIAVSTDGKWIYTSSMNYEAGTGSLVFIDAGAKKAGVTVELPEGMARLNGIEVSPDNTQLFVTSAGKPEGGRIPGAEIWVFDLENGMPKNGRVLFDIYKTLSDNEHVQSGGLDPDGMRCDIAGNLYSTLNAASAVLRVNTKDATDYEVAQLATVAFPTNLEIGGEDGKELVVVGRCLNDGEIDGEVTESCVDVAEVGAEGRAWKMLQGGGSAPTPGKGCKLRQSRKARRAAYAKN